MRLRRLVELGGLCVLTALLLASCARSSEEPAASGATSATASRAASTSAARTPVMPATHQGARESVHHVFAPYDASGRLTAKVSGGTHTGKCWTTSIAVPIAGVYRCFADNEILDPCFAPAVETSPPTLACFADPWHPGTLLTLRGPLPKDEPVPTDGHPWALQLANGARCVAITGVVPTVDGVTLEYSCASGDMAGLRAGADGQLTARYGSTHGPLHVEQVAAEWRGRSYRIGPAQ
jgi:hypothetical protein